MDICLYPAQEPLSEVGQSYHSRVISMGAGLEGQEAQYGGDPHQRITVFPTDVAGAPVLLFFHGGGWVSGYKEWMAFMAPAVNALGLTFAIAGYRLAPQHVFPTGLHDCAEAVAWLWHNATSFNVNKNHLFVGGHSAGGHYAALLSVTHDWQHLLSLPPTVIRGCAPVSGVYRFGDNSGITVRPRFLGPVDQNNESHASPLLQIQKPVCPFLISYGENDFPHLKRQADEMCTALIHGGGIVEKLVLPECDHFGASLAAGEVGGLWARHVGEWVDTVCNGSNTNSSDPSKV